MNDSYLLPIYQTVIAISATIEAKQAKTGYSVPERNAMSLYEHVVILQLQI